jgi:rod shape-determining protein MreD
MRNIVEGAVGVILGVVIFAILGKISASLLILLNAFSWVVLYFALARHEVFGAVMGTVCGLLQDSLSLGVFGVGGLTKTLLGFGAGYVSRKINVTPLTRTFVFVLVMAAAELFLWKSLVHFLFGEALTASGGLALFQPLLTALGVSLVFQARRRWEAGRL